MWIASLFLRFTATSFCPVSAGAQLDAFSPGGDYAATTIAACLSLSRPASQRGDPPIFWRSALPTQSSDKQRYANKLKYGGQPGSTNFANCLIYFGQRMQAQ